MEQLRHPEATHTAETQPVPHAADPQRLPALIGAALGETDEGTRRTLAGEINEMLIAMRAPGNEAAEQAALLTHLESAQLNALVDAKGRHCRKEAVETLLSLGFPYALEVNPADLDFARSHKDTVAGQVLIVCERRRKDQLNGAAWVATLGNAPLAGMGWSLALEPGLLVEGLLTVLGALLALGSAWQLASSEVSDEPPTNFGAVHLLGALLGLLAVPHFGVLAFAGAVASAIWARRAFAKKPDFRDPKVEVKWRSTLRL